MQDISFSDFDKLIFMIILFFAPICTIFLLFLGFAQMSKRSNWMTRLSFGLSVALLIMCVLVGVQFMLNTRDKTGLGIVIICFVIFGASSFGFKAKINRDK